MLDRLSSLIVRGFSAREARELRELYAPTFRSRSFRLLCPKLDDSLRSRLPRDVPSGSADYAEKILVSSQYKVLDIVRPILHLKSLCPVSGEIAETIDNALSLWGAALNEFSKSRRNAVLQATDPSFTGLLKDERNFSRREYQELFGSTFLQAMVKRANDESSLNNATRSAHASRRQRSMRRFSNSRLRTAFQPPNANQNYSSFSNSFTSRPNYNTSRPWNSSGFGYVIAIDSSPEIVIGGRLSKFLWHWKSISADPWVLAVIKEGYRLDFTSPPHQSRAPRGAPMGPDSARICQEKVQALLKKGRFSGWSCQTGFVSSIFVVKKSSGGYRPIINLKPLNNLLLTKILKWRG